VNLIGCFRIVLEVVVPPAKEVVGRSCLSAAIPA
jgi:hypothetical protein